MGEDSKWVSFSRREADPGASGSTRSRPSNGRATIRKSKTSSPSPTRTRTCEGSGEKVSSELRDVYKRQALRIWRVVEGVCVTQAGFAEALLIGSGNVFGEIEKGPGEGRLFRFLRGDISALVPDFLQQEAGRHQFVRHAFAHLEGSLIQRARYLAEAGDIVLIVFDGLE